MTISFVDCVMSHVGEDGIRHFAKSKNTAANVDSIDFGVWKEDVRKLRDEKSLDGLEVYGFTLDTQTGVVEEVNI